MTTLARRIPVRWRVLVALLLLLAVVFAFTRAEWTLVGAYAVVLAGLVVAAGVRANRDRFRALGPGGKASLTTFSDAARAMAADLGRQFGATPGEVLVASHDIFRADPDVQDPATRERAEARLLEWVDDPTGLAAYRRRFGAWTWE